MKCDKKQSKCTLSSIYNLTFNVNETQEFSSLIINIKINECGKTDVTS